MKYPSIQISGKNNKGEWVLSVLTKRTYQLLADGRCVDAENQLPIFQDISFYEDNENLIFQDTDLIPYKIYTDIIVKGIARSVRPLPEFKIGVQVGNAKTTISVIGNREATLVSNRLVFSKPTPIQEVPLKYDYAYGGKDSVAESKFEDIVSSEIRDSFPDGTDFLVGNLTRYPRNPEGTGYIVQLESLKVKPVQLPNLEDSKDRLTPSRLLVSQPERWFAQPIPRATDWVSPVWFPRLAYFGLYKLPPNTLIEDVEEIKRGWAEKKLLSSKFSSSFRAVNSGSVGLQASGLQIGADCQLINIHPKKVDYKFKLPQDIPQIFIDGRNGKLIKTKPVIHSVVIEPEMDRISILWRGAGKALRPYFSEELIKMPFNVIW